MSEAGPQPAPSWRAARALALIACAALLAAPWRGHVDDFDAGLYLVVARNLARDHCWFAMRFLPSFHPVFRQHLPFGLWPAVVAIRVAGEWAVPMVYALLTLGAIAAAGRMARTLSGPRAEIAAILLLGTCESIWQYGGRPLLDPPLLLLATLSVAAALEDRWAAAALFAGAAALVKGPFGLLPLASVALARFPERRGPLAALAATLPLAAFLLLDPGGGWRTGYLREQLLGSATSGWDGSVASWWFPLVVIARRFWPGLPFALLGIWRARSDARLRPLALASALAALALALPARKWGNHAYVVFPMLAALGGAAVAPWTERLRLGWVAGASAVSALVFASSGAGARLLRPPCAFSTALREPLLALPAQAPILVVSRLWDPLAQLAAERDLLPRLVPALPAEVSVRDAVAVEGTPIPAPWAVVASGAGFSLLHAP